MRPGPAPSMGCARPALCRRCVGSPRRRWGGRAVGVVVGRRSPLVLRKGERSQARDELPLRAGRGGEEERSGEGPRIRCGAVPEASKDADSCAPAGGTWKRGRMQGASGGGRQDRHGPQQPGIAGTGGGPRSQSTSAFRRRPPGKRQAGKPSGRRPQTALPVLVSIAPDMQ